jgi:hypothetical protein
MRKRLVVPAVVGAFILVGACTNVQPPPVDSMQLASARQSVKIYDAMPPNGTPIEQITATSCDGTRQAATDRLIFLASQRGGNGITQLSCTDQGISMACWSSATCSALAVNVVEPPPPPPVAPPRRRAAPRAKRAN